MKHILASASLIALMATGAQASVVDLTSGGDANVGAYTFDNGDVSGTITITRNFFGTPSLTQTSEGLGVTGFLDNTSQLDSQAYETIKFTFDSVVDLMSVTFGSFESDEWAMIGIDGSSLFNAGTGVNPYGFGVAGTGVTSFTVGAQVGLFSGDYNGFRVSSIDVAAVPLPAAGFLLLGALGGLGALRRRKKSS